MDHRSCRGLGKPLWCGCSAEVRLGQCPQQRKGVPALPGHAEGEDAMELQRWSREVQGFRKLYFLIQ